MAVDIATLGIEVRTRGVQQANAQLRDLEAGGKRAENAIGGLGRQFQALGAALSGAALLAASRSILRTADEMTNLSSRLKLVTKSSQELVEVQSRLFEQSQASQTSLRANADLYISLARSTQDLWISQDRLLSVTDGIGKALAVSGTSAAAAAGGLLQLSQALQSGVLRGEEFNSVSEQIPRLAQAIADGMGIARSELRAYAMDGKLTTDVVLPALEKGLVSVREEFDQLAPTIGRATTALGNAFDKLIADGNGATGVTAAIAGSIALLAENLDGAANVVGVVAVAAIGRFVGATTTSTVATIADVLAKRKALSAEVAYQQGLARTAGLQAQTALSSAALTAARNAEAVATSRAAAAQAAGVTGVGLARGAIGLLGGPIGALVTVLGTAAIAWSAFGNSSENAGEKAVSAADAAVEARKRLAELAKNDKFGDGELGDQRQRLEAARKELDAYERIANLSKSGQAKKAALERDVVDIEKLVQRLETSQGGIDSSPVVGAAYKRFMDETGEFATKAEENIEKVNKISRGYAAAIKAIAESRPTVDPLATDDGIAALERYKTLLGEVQEEINKAALASENELRKALVEAMRDGSTEAKRLKDEISDLLREAKNIRSGVSGAGAKAQERRDRGLTDEERDTTNLIRADEALTAAQRASTFAQNAALDGRTEKAVAYAKQAAEMLGRASQYADKIQDDASAIKIFDQIAEAEAAALESQAKVKQSELADIENRTAGQARALTELESRVNALKTGAATVTVDTETGAAMIALQSVKDMVDAIPSKKVIEIAWSSSGSAPSAPVPDLPSRASGGVLPGDDRGDRSDHMLYWGTPGEHVIQRPAVRYYGSDFISALNEMRLPKFAFGGELRAPSVPRPSASMSAMDGIGERVPSNLVVPGIGSFPIESRMDVEAEMVRAFRNAALKRGSRS